MAPSPLRSGRSSWTAPRSILDKPKRDFDEPSGKVLNGDIISVPSVSGMSVEGGHRGPQGGRLQGPGRRAAPTAAMSEGTVVYTDPERPGGPRHDGRALHLARLRPGAPKPKTTPKPKKTTEEKTPEPTKTPDTRRPRPPSRLRRTRSRPEPAYGSARAPHHPVRGPRICHGGMPAGLPPPESAAFTAAATRPAVGAAGDRALGGLHDLAHLRHPGRAGLGDGLRRRAPAARRRRAGPAGRPRARRARPPRLAASSGRPASR